MHVRDQRHEQVAVRRENRVEVGEIQLRIDALHVQVQRHRDEVHVPGAFAVAEKRAFHSVGAGQQPQLGGRHAGAAVVVRVQADHQRVAVPDVAAHPLDLVGVKIRHRDFDGVGQVQDHFPVRRRMPDVHDGFRDFPGELDFGRAEAFGRILQHDFRAFEPRQTLFDPGGAPHGHLNPGRSVTLPIGRRGGQP